MNYVILIDIHYQISIIRLVVLLRQQVKRSSLCAQSLTHVWLFDTPWTAAHQAPLSLGILQARILEWVAMPSSRGSSQSPLGAVDIDFQNRIDVPPSQTMADEDLEPAWGDHEGRAPLPL